MTTPTSPPPGSHMLLLQTRAGFVSQGLGTGATSGVRQYGAERSVQEELGGGERKCREGKGREAARCLCLLLLLRDARTKAIASFAVIVLFLVLASLTIPFFFTFSARCTQICFYPSL